MNPLLQLGILRLCLIKGKTHRKEITSDKEHREVFRIIFSQIIDYISDDLIFFRFIPKNSFFVLEIFLNRCLVVFKYCDMVHLSARRGCLRVKEKWISRNNGLISMVMKNKPEKPTDFYNLIELWQYRYKCFGYIYFVTIFQPVIFRNFIRKMIDLIILRRKSISK